jgi:hypothetical protein
MPHLSPDADARPTRFDSASTGPGRAYSSPRCTSITAASITAAEPNASTRSLHPGDRNHHDGLYVPYVRRWHGSVGTVHRHIDYWPRCRHGDRNNRSCGHHRDIPGLNWNGVINRSWRYIHHRRSGVDHKCSCFSAGGEHQTERGGGGCTDKTNIHANSLRFDRPVSSSLEAAPPGVRIASGPCESVEALVAPTTERYANRR